MNSAPRGATALALYLLVAAVLTTAYWARWFTISGGPPALSALTRAVRHAPFSHSLTLTHRADFRQAQYKAHGGQNKWAKVNRNLGRDGAWDSGIAQAGIDAIL